MTSRLTVLHLVANRWWTGSADSVIRLVQGLRARGHQVLLAAPPGDRFELKARAGGIEPLPGVGLDPKVRPWVLLRDVVLIRRAIRRHRVDVLHVHHSHDHWLAAVVGTRTALVRTFHNLRAVRPDAASAWLYARTDAAVAVSRPIVDRCVAVGFRPETVVRLEGSTDLERFTPRDPDRSIRDEFKVGEAPLVGCVARFSPSRGHDRLLRAFRLLLERVPEARLLLIGRGEHREALEALIAELRLDTRVIFTGYRDRDLPEVLAALDCVVLIEAGSDESCRAVLEAMAAGRAVVARRVGAIPDTIVHGQTGLLVDADTADALADALAWTLADRARARAMGAAGRRRVEADFHPTRQVETIEGLYRTILGRP